MKNPLKYFIADSWAGLLLNLAIILAAGVGLLLLFFYVYLPAETNHAETVTVPDLRGLDVSDVQSNLTSRDLRFEVSDSLYNPDFGPNKVITHYPEPGKKVKIDRKIYLTLNTTNPPLVPLPDVIDGSLKNARITLKNYGLQVGEVEYVPSSYRNNIMTVLIEGEEISKQQMQAGYKVPKGTKVALEVGAGLGQNEMEIPELVGMPVTEAELYLEGLDLGVGMIDFVDTTGVADGTVVKQFPRPEKGAIIRVGEIIDLWIAGSYPVQDVPGDPNSATDPLED